MRYVPNKPEGVLRNDDLSITIAAMPESTSLGSDGGELLPFVGGIKAAQRPKRKLATLRNFRRL